MDDLASKAEDLEPGSENADEAYRMKPDVVSFNSLIYALGRAGQAEEAVAKPAPSASA